MGKTEKKPVIKLENKAFNLRDYTTLFGLILLVIISTVMSETFLLPVNVSNILRQVAAPGCMAIGMTFVILTAGIDLSVGSIMAFSGVVIAMAASSYGILGGILTALAVSIIIGIAYGLCITKLNVPPFIATLAGYSIFRGLALVLTSSMAIPISEPGFSLLGTYKLPSTISIGLLVVVGLVLVRGYLTKLKKGFIKNSVTSISALVAQIALLVVMGYIVIEVSGLNIQIIIFGAVFALFLFLLNKTSFGREVYAVGGNIEAARLAGINVNKTLIYVYIINATLACLAGALTAARLSSGTPQVGIGGELDAIAAVVIGGTSLMGGVGRLQGTLIGILLIGVLNNLLSLLGVTADMQLIFKGAIVLGSVILDTKFRSKD